MLRALGLLQGLSSTSKSALYVGAFRSKHLRVISCDSSQIADSSTYTTKIYKFDTIIWSVNVTKVAIQEIVTLAKCCI